LFILSLPCIISAIPLHAHTQFRVRNKDETDLSAVYEKHCERNYNEYVAFMYSVLATVT
jgi:hypothetical protein